MSVLKIRNEQGDWIAIPTIKGDDGHSPIVTATKTNGVTTILVDGTPIATINDGEDMALTISADEYSASATYDIGDYCIYNRNLYKCNTVIETAEAWNPNHWTQITITDEIQTLKQDLSLKVDDVQVNGTSVVTDGVANIPYASQEQGGVVKVINSGSGGFQIDQGFLLIKPASSQFVKNGLISTLTPIIPGIQHQSTFYGLAKAAGDTTQSASNNAVGTYTDEAKTAIKNMIGVEDPAVNDVQINGTSIVTNGVAEIPLGNKNTFGIVKIGGGLETSNGTISVAMANADAIKAGTSTGNFLRPVRQHESTFYGLAKAAGDTTQSSSSNAVGTYTDEAKTAIQNMLDVVSKPSLDNAGITNTTYNTKFDGEFTVTTATTTGYNNPYARASVTGRINKENMHRVTVNGTVYILPTRLWYVNTSSQLKVYEYLGNLGLYIEDTSGIPGGTDNVPFVIISDLNNSNSIDILTNTAGTYTFLVEQINYTKKKIPNTLIYGDNYEPILKNNNGGTYNGFSIGVNELINKRGTMAFGYGNKISDEFSTVIGTCNEITKKSVLIGSRNTSSGNGSVSVGYGNITSGASSVAIGQDLTANGSTMVAMGHKNVPANTVFPNFQPNTLYKKGDIVKGVYASPMTSLIFICTTTHISANSTYLRDDQDSNGIVYWILAPSDGDTLFVVGNGSVKNSNAMKVGLLGDCFLGGALYVNCNDDSTGGTRVLEDIQIDGTSIVENGVAEIPVANSSTAGVIKIAQWGGLITGSENDLQINAASAPSIKQGTSTKLPIVPATQHQSTFYALAKAAGDTTQSASSNAVGTYTDEALVKIQKMLRIYEPPWELIDDITLEEESGFDRSADSNGTPYNFIAVYMVIAYPANASTGVGSGRYNFVDENNKELFSDTGKYSTSQYVSFKLIRVLRKGGLAYIDFTTSFTSGGRGSWNVRPANFMEINYGTVRRIYSPSADKEPAGTNIKIYAQRAY